MTFHPAALRHFITTAAVICGVAGIAAGQEAERAPEQVPATWEMALHDKGTACVRMER